jgi:hypothetical protein
MSNISFSNNKAKCIKPVGHDVKNSGLSISHESKEVANIVKEKAKIFTEITVAKVVDLQENVLNLIKKSPYISLVLAGCGGCILGRL